MNQTPTPPEPPVGAVHASPMAPAAEPQKNTIGLVALIASIVGFIFACIPGALIVGWILLPVGFILAIVALVQKGKKKGMGITALVLSVVGTIVGMIVFFAVAVDAVAESFDEEFGGGDIAVVDEEPAAPDADEAGQDDAAQEEPAVEPEEEETDASGPAGTREDPLPFGSTIQNDDWTITLSNFNADANAEVADANMFNEEPTDGMQWIVLEVSATYSGEDAGNTLELTFDYVTADGNVVDEFGASGLEPEFDGFAELYTGATAAGKIGFLVPDTVDGMVRVTPSLFGDDVFFALP